MATDGVKIIDGDFASDLYGTFMELYDAGESIEQIKATLDTHRDASEGFEHEIFITVYALALWQIGELTPDIRQEVKQAIERGAGAEVWAEEVDEKAANKRRRELARFWLKINQSNPKIRKRKIKKTTKNFIFDENEVLIFQLPNHDWCATILVNILQHQGRCYYNFIASTYRSSIKPTLDDVRKAEISGREQPLGFGNYEVLLNAILLFPKVLRSFKDQLGPIGKLEIAPLHKEIGSIRGARDFVSFYENWADNEVFAKDREEKKFSLQPLLVS